MSAPPAEITLTWARGLLEESVEDTGALALVLTALARELERPIAHESAGAPVSASIEHEADTCGISLRGDPDALRAAARRLPSLFTRPLIAEGSSPRPSSAPLWREDLLARTGGSALALQGLDALGPGARDEARRLLRELDPWRGTVNCLLRTDDRTLREVLAIAAPVRLAREPTGWADGTSRWRPGAAPGAAVVASPAGGELCSVMVPRTPDGSTVGELLRIILADALVASGHERTMISPEYQGMGEGMRVVLSISPPLPDEHRAQVLTELLRQMPLLPDSWIESVRVRTGCPSWLERGRSVRGMDEAPPSSIDGVRRALEDAQESIHLALDPRLLDFAAHRRLAELPVHGPAHEDPAAPVRAFTLSRRGRRSGGSAPSTRVRLTRSSLAVEDDSDGCAVVSLDRLVAVLEDEAGARSLIDRRGSTVTVRTADLEDGELLESYLVHSLRRVPHLRCDAEGPRIHPLVARGNRRRALASLALGSVAAVLVGAGVLSVLDPHEEPEPEDAWTRQVLAWGETAELSNGTRITAAQLVVEQDIHRLTVSFCGGADTEGPGSDGEEADEMVQNIVRPGDFDLYTASGAALPALEVPEGAEGLPSEWLDDGECVTGDLRFDSVGGQGSDLVYRNSLGDSIVWKDG